MPADILGPDRVEDAARILREGGLVAFPTDTVYGVAALADSELHSAKLQAFKGGRREPFSLHLPDVDSALRFGGPMRELERHAVTQLGPRGVTVIVAHGSSHAGLGLRIVQHETGSVFLKLANAAVVATSANLHGQPPLCDPDAIAGLPGVAAVLSTGELPERPASSVVRMLRCGLEILRESAVSKSELGGTFTRNVEFVCLGNLNRSAFAEHLLRAMQQYYVSQLRNFVPAFHLDSSGLIGSPSARVPAGMHEAAAAYHVEMKAHVPSRFEAAAETPRELIAMGEDVWGEVIAADKTARRWTVYDPMGGSPMAYRATADQVRAHMEALLARTAVVREGDASMESGFDNLFSPVSGDDT
ncbi:MAG: Sua5/YciO/YrdC/YwlC family protein [Planctomycetes bacterium]|nr:Sua5/YciO/YrdC/YwlC family protein [Planctomycetota bacterium]